MTSESAMEWVGTEKFNNNMRGTAYYFMEEDASSAERLHAGDVILYPGHISIMYSDRWGASAHAADLQTDYDIIHASGDARLKYKNGTVVPFNRKVTVNSIGKKLGSDTLKKPKGYGRLMIWE